MHRWYDPATRRWISEDPIGFAAGDASLYRYVGNGVTGATDPSGFQAYTITRQVIKGIGIARLEPELHSYATIPFKILKEYLKRVVTGHFKSKNERWYTPGLADHPLIAKFVDRRYEGIATKNANAIATGRDGAQIVVPNQKWDYVTAPKFTDGLMGAAIGTPASVEMRVLDAHLVKDPRQGYNCYLALHVEWSMRDEIDWRSMKELYDKLPADATFGEKAAAFFEGGFSIIGDSILSANYFLEMYWQENVKIELK